MGHVGSFEEALVLDTGAAFSVCTRPFLETANLWNVIEKRNAPNGRGLGGEREVLCSVRLSIRFQGITVLATVRVIKDCPYPILLATEVLTGTTINLVENDRSWDVEGVKKSSSVPVFRIHGQAVRALC